MAPRHLTRMHAALVLAGSLAACSDNEAPAEDHTPSSYTVLVDGVETPAPFALTQGQTVTVQLKVFNAAGDDLDDVEAEHFGGLTFEPATLATATRIVGHNYRFSVTGSTTGTGTVQVSYGHDELADQTTFTPVAITVEAAT